MLSVPGLIVSGIAQINSFTASFVGSASARVVSYLYYADRIDQLPLGIVDTAIGLVVLPNLNRALLEGDEVDAQELLQWVLEVSLFLILPAAAALAVYALGLPGYLVAKAGNLPFSRERICARHSGLPSVSA
jgi:putative peptidoglycan lipid II flippase